MTFAPDLSVGDALDLYFEQAGFGRETYSDRWVRLPVGPATLLLPNLGPRKEVVPLHDINHVLTEYETDWTGEFQITGYELGRGLGRYWFGWIIDLQAIWLALAISPRKTVRAFARGRRARSLYRKRIYDDALLETTVGDLRSALRIHPEEEVAVTASDLCALLGRLALSLLIHSPLLAIGAAAAYALFA